MPSDEELAAARQEIFDKYEKVSQVSCLQGCLFSL